MRGLRLGSVLAVAAAIYLCTGVCTGQAQSKSGSPAGKVQAASPQRSATHRTVARVTGVREADRVCAKCHAEIFESYLKTPMANASGAAAEAVVPGGFLHGASGVRYDVEVDGGQVWLKYGRPGDRDMQGRQKLDFFVGSGKRGRTYLYELDGYWFEDPINYYAGKQGYDMAPNYLDARQMPFNLPVNAGCLHCHTSGAQLEEAGTKNHYAGLPFLHRGITCEACHADGTRHAADGKAAIVNPIKLDAARRDAVCANCHLEGETNVQHPGKSIAEYKAGDDLSKFISYYVHEGTPGTQARAVSQVEALALSKCKRVSGEKMSCMSCHDPHVSPAAADRVAYYRGKCLACHTEDKFAAQHHAQQPDCASCHMAKAATQDVAHTQSSDHRILKRAEKPGLAETLWASSRLIVVPGTQVDAAMADRDMALALFDLRGKGTDKQREETGERAERMLKAAAKANPKDSAVLAALGVLAQQNGDRKQAAELYQRALEADGGNWNAAANLGVILAQEGQAAGAAKLWRGVYERNRDISALGVNLAVVECSLGEKAAAEEVIRNVLRFDPDNASARSALGRVSGGCGQ